jgi:hypothetical protein
MELTEQDREQIQKQIAEIKALQESRLPLAPNGQDENQNLEKALTAVSIPNKLEEKAIKKKMKKLWGFWRNTALDSKSLEIEKIACQIELERAQTEAKLATIKREQEIAAHQHWLKLNEGNLKDIGYNTESKPNLLWYGLKRMLYHITKLTTDVPKVVSDFFWIGYFILAIIILKTFGVI